MIAGQEHIIVGREENSGTFGPQEFAAEKRQHNTEPLVEVVVDSEHIASEFFAKHRASRSLFKNTE